MDDVKVTAFNQIIVVSLQFVSNTTHPSSIEVGKMRHCHHHCTLFSCDHSGLSRFLAQAKHSANSVKNVVLLARYCGKTDGKHHRRRNFAAKKAQIVSRNAEQRSCGLEALACTFAFATLHVKCNRLRLWHL